METQFSGIIMNYWEFNRLMLKRLMGWNIVNVATGIALARNEDPHIKGIGTQAFGWGAINLGIVLFGRLTTQRRIEKLEDPLDPALMADENRKLYRLLWINNRLNLLYMLFGGWLAATKGRDNAQMRGNGIGIVIQGALLFIHDTIHARKLKAKLNE